MLALIKQEDDLIVPDVNGEPIRLAATLEEHFPRTAATVSEREHGVPLSSSIA